MAHNSPQTLDDALTQYLPQMKEEGRREAQAELVRFVQWCGRAKQLQALAPPLVEDYVQSKGGATAEAVHRLEAVKTFLAYMGRQKWTATNLAPHVKLPKTRKPVNTQNNRPAPEQAHLTQEGVEQLQKQREQLKEQRVTVVADISRAMADKDFRENAPLDAAKERQGLIEADIRALDDILARAVVTTTNAAEWTPSKEQGRVRPGRRVTVRDLRNDREASYILVDAREADPVAGKLSLTSPVGRAILGRKAGDEVTVTAPSGALRFRIEKVEG